MTSVLDWWGDWRRRGRRTRRDRSRLTIMRMTGSYARDEGDFIVTHAVTHYRSAADLARGDEVDKQANALRAKAHTPLENLAGKTKGSRDQRALAIYNLTNAHHYKWIGKYDQ